MARHREYEARLSHRIRRGYIMEGDGGPPRRRSVQPFLVNSERTRIPMAYLRLMGRVALEGEADPLERLASRRHPLALLALLATAPSLTMSRGKLVGLLWPESSEKRARHRLSTCLYNVRRVLGDDVLISTGDNLRLDPSCLPCDVVAFEQAVESRDHEAAVERYGGPFMDGFHLEGAAEFDRIVERVRARLERVYGDSLEALAREAEERGDVEAAAERWRERANDDPYDSGVAVRLVKALHAAGNSAAALRVARAHTDRLRSELGVEPGEELRVLVDRLKKGSEAPEAARDGWSPIDRPLPGPQAEASRREQRVESPPAEYARSGVAADDDPTNERDGGVRGRERKGPYGEFRTRGIRVALVAIALVVGVAGGWYLIGVAGAEDPRSGANPVAVLPFQTLGEKNDPVAEGIHVDLLTRLSNVSGLKVVSGTTVERYRDVALDLPTIADRLGVARVVEGSVQRAGDRIRVNAQLIDPRTDTHLWAATYDRELTTGSLFEIQGEITTAIARALEARLTPEEKERVERMPTGDLEAYRLYVRARRRMDSREESDLRAAAVGFRRAIERDPEYGLAWAGLADALDLLSGKGFDPPVDAPEAETAARRALELDPDLSEAHATLGNIALGRREGPAAIRHLRRAVELRPSYGTAHHWLGLAWLVLGYPDAALEHSSLAVELGPTLVAAHRALAWTHLARGEVHRALRETREARRMLEKGTLEHRKIGREEAVVLYHMGRYPEVRQMAREEATEWPGGGQWLATGLLAMIDVAAGDTSRARTRLDRMTDEQAPPLYRAWVHAALGERERAVAQLSHTIDRDEILIAVLFRYAFPEAMASVRDDPGYRQLLGRLNLNWGLEPDGRVPLGF